ncbi:unnamed protein product [Ectocarpus sp. 8 AP-2014]
MGAGFDMRVGLMCALLTEGCVFFFSFVVSSHAGERERERERGAEILAKVSERQEGMGGG